MQALRRGEPQVEGVGPRVLRSLVRPDRLAGLEARSVRKRMKDKAFARSVSREDIARGAEDLGVALDDHITFCIQAMRGIAHQLGLAAEGGNST